MRIIRTMATRVTIPTPAIELMPARVTIGSAIPEAILNIFAKIQAMRKSGIRNITPPTTVVRMASSDLVIIMDSYLWRQTFVLPEVDVLDLHSPSRPAATSGKHCAWRRGSGGSDWPMYLSPTATRAMSAPRPADKLATVPFVCDLQRCVLITSLRRRAIGWATPSQRAER